MPAFRDHRISAANGNQIINESAYDAAVAARIKGNATLTRAKKFHEENPDAEALVDFIYTQAARGNKFWTDIRDSYNEWGNLRPRVIEIIRERLAQDGAKKAEWKARDAASQHVGLIGDRIDFDATVTFVYHGESDFGAFNITGLRDDAGNLYIHKGSANVAKGERYHVRATIKGHDEREGVKQTRITRPKWTKIEEGA